MNVLIVSSKPPFPPIDGGCFAVASVIQGLVDEAHVVTSFSIATPKHSYEQSNFPLEVKSVSSFIDTNISIVKAFFNLFCKQSYFTARFHSKEAENKLLTLIQNEKFDIIQLEGIYLSSYFNAVQQNTRARIVYRSHNIEHQLVEQKMRGIALLKRWYLKLQAKKLKAEEFFIVENCNGVACISPQSVDFFTQNTQQKNCTHIPTGITLNHFEYKPRTTFFHIGAMDWQPNIDGIDWLVKNVWEKLENDIQLHLAGKALDKKLYFGQKNVLNHGEVENASTFMQNHGVMLIPLFSGSGIRIKIIEAGAMGIPIIATKKAVEGLQLVKNQEYLEANSASEFIDCIQKIKADLELQTKLSKAIQTKIKTQFEQKNITKKFIEFYQNI